MSAILPNPLTPPPSEYSHEFPADIDHGLMHTPSPIEHVEQHSFPTPQSETKISLESSDESLDMEDRLDRESEDEDMSDGGASVNMTLSHAEELNAEMDLVDAEVMGPENLVGLSQDTHPPAQVEELFPNQNALSNFEVNQISQLFSIAHAHELAQATALAPSLVAEALQQLPQAQDVPEHADPMDMPDEIHPAFFVDQSTSTNSFSPLFPPPTISPLPVLVVDPHHLPGLFSDPIIVPDTFPNVGEDAEDETVDANIHEVEEQLNMGFGDFLMGWARSGMLDDSRRGRAPSILAVERQRSEKVGPVQRSDLQGDRCDIQRINWVDLGISRSEAREVRRKTYKNYTNLPIDPYWHPALNNPRVAVGQNFFKFRRMDFDHKVHLAHFQLRNLMACATRDHIFYAGKHKVMQCNPWNNSNSSEAKPATVAMDLTDPVVQPQHGLGGSIQISTLAVGHDILIAGGFCGEYGLLNLKAHKDTKHTEGIITENMNSITNHVQVHLSRSSSLPLASFASNDNGMRILDISTNKFIAEHNYDHAINCSAISPDQRLRVIVGDTQSVMICNADTGEILQSLEGHRDFGFACDWADDGWTVATGNQDMQVKIWDARKWTTSQGLAYPVATLAAEMAGVRKLKFSPLGSGKRVLLAAEPADIITVFDAETFASKQTLSFFGEIGGVDFTNNGQDIFVSNCDIMRGGLMEFERCGHASSSLYELEDRPIRSRHRQRGGYDWLPTDERVVNHPKARGTEEQRRRKPASLGITMGHF